MVSILVLVDSSLRPPGVVGAQGVRGCFNPCFSGFVITTLKRLKKQYFIYCFNPCFSGFVITTIPDVMQTTALHVSILVLVDSSLRPDVDSVANAQGRVSILVLVDSSLRLSMNQSILLTLPSFNPCFSGFVITTSW